MPDAELVASTVENVRVVVRVRPMDQREKIEGSYNCVSVDPVNSTIAVTRSNSSPPEPPRIYAYDAVFDSDTSQPINYCTVAMACIHDSRQVCASSIDGCTRRSFLDQCDMFEYNCDYKTDFEMEDCEHQRTTQGCKKRSLLLILPHHDYFHSIYGRGEDSKDSDDNDENDDSQSPKIVTKDPSDTTKTTNRPEKLQKVPVSSKNVNTSPCFSHCGRPHTWGTTVKGETRDFFRVLQEQDY